MFWKRDGKAVGTGGRKIPEPWFAVPLAIWFRHQGIRRAASYRHLPCCFLSLCRHDGDWLWQGVVQVLSVKSLGVWDSSETSNSVRTACAWLI